jgi:hypothetical protein
MLVLSKLPQALPASMLLSEAETEYNIGLLKQTGRTESALVNKAELTLLALTSEIIEGKTPIFSFVQSARKTSDCEYLMLLLHKCLTLMEIKALASKILRKIVDLLQGNNILKTQA